MAHQAIIFALESWVERPLTTSTLFIIPRTLSHAWVGLSRHLVELGTWKPNDFDLLQPPLLPIPFVVLHLATYTRVLPIDRTRLDQAPLSQERRWHQQQAAVVRSLLPSSLDH